MRWLLTAIWADAKKFKLVVEFREASGGGDFALKRMDWTWSFDRLDLTALRADEKILMPTF